MDRFRSVIPISFASSIDFILRFAKTTLQAQDLFEQSKHIIAIDALKAGGPPWSLYLMDATDARLSRAYSLHHLSLPGLLRMMPASRRPRVSVIGIEPRDLDYGLTLSNPVADTLDRITQCVYRFMA